MKVSGRARRALRALAASLALLCACEAPSAVERARAAEAAGDWRTARAAWQVAVETRDRSVSAAAGRLGLGQAQARLGEPAARETLERALLDADAAGEALTAARSRQALARLALWQGRPEEARALVERALAEPTETWPPALRLELSLTRAAALWRQGELAAAESLWTALRPQAETLGDDSLIVRATEGLAGALRFRGRFEAAAALCTGLAPRARRQANIEERARTLANCAGIQGSAGNVAGARALATEAVGAADASGSARAQVHARNALAAQLIDAGAADAALPFAQAAAERARAAGVEEYLDDALLYVALAQERLGRREDAEARLVELAALPTAPSARTAEALALRGRLALARGDAEAALSAFGESVAAVEELRAAVTPRQLHEFFDRDRRAPYLGLVDLLVRRGHEGDAARALQIVGQLESRSFLEGLRRAEALTATDTLAAIATPASTAPSASPAPSAPTLPLAPSVGSGERRAGGFDVGDLRRALPAGLAVLEWVPLDTSTLVFLTTASGVRVERVLLAGDALEALVGDYIARLSGLDESEAPARRLAEVLLAPVSAALEALPAETPLCVIPHGRLRGLPAEALPWRGAPLGARHPVFTAPSLPALVELLKRSPPAAPGPPLIVADAGGDLPGARAEAARLAARWPLARLLMGPEATETRVRALLPGAEPVHFGVHGYPAGPARSAFLALSPGDAQDGRLTPPEVAGLTLPGALVMLSACETSAGRPNATGELPDVLDRAFLHAGARAVVSTRWPVNDAVAAAFNEVFYAELPARGALGAFTAAQRRLASGRGAVVALGTTTRGLRRPNAALGPPDARRPGHWAGFVFHGNPR